MAGPIPVAVRTAGFALDLAAVRVVMQRELIRTLEDRTRFVAALVQPLLFLFVLGVGLSSLTGAATGPIDLPTFMYPGILATSTMFTAVFSAVTVVWDREFGFLREMLVAPVHRSAIVVGKALGGATVATLQAVVLLVLAPVVDVPLSVALVVQLLALVMLLSFTLTALGLAIVVGIRQVQTVMGIMQMVLLPLSFLSGAMFPLSGLPGWLDVAVKLNPVTYGVHPVRSAVFDRLDLPPEVVATLNPPITWGGWAVPGALQVLLVAVVGVALLAVAVRKFGRIE